MLSQKEGQFLARLHACTPVRQNCAFHVFMLYFAGKTKDCLSGGGASEPDPSTYIVVGVVIFVLWIGIEG